MPPASRSTIAAAISNGIQPWLAITKVNATVALEDCRTMVMTVPTSTNISTEKNPQSVHFWINAMASGLELRSGTESLRKLSPRKSMAKPMIISPMFLRFCDLNIMKAKPMPIRGMERVDISAVKPSKDMSHEVTVVPILAPMMTPTACVRLRSPALTKLTIITVVALED